MSEKQRLDFVRERDGAAAMLKFAEQGLYAYVRASLERGPYAEAIAEYRSLLEQSGRRIRFVVVDDAAEPTE
jgi:hypothetical protein